jgi:ferredoxin, 2Fe-2S
MIRVTFKRQDGGATVVDARGGLTLMEAAVLNGVEGIDGECGGVCICATCHVYVETAWRRKLNPAAQGESAMLEAIDDRREGSRLACQIKLTEALNGLVVEMPDKQGSVK